MRRFYQRVEVVPLTGGGYGLTLDGAALRTPARRLFCVADRRLAEGAYAEWARQGDRIEPARMPVTRLIHVAIDRTPTQRAEIIAECLRYLETDTILCRAEGPQVLTQRQAVEWDPIIDWAAAAFGVCFACGSGLQVPAQSAAAKAALADYLGELDDLGLTVLAHGAALFASLLLACAWRLGRLSGSEALVLSNLDERFQRERWGEDAEAAARAGALEVEIGEIDAAFAGALG